MTSYTQSADPRYMERSFPDFVVGIGASAGGLEAYTEFFDALQPSTGMAFVVVLHLHPAAHSQLAEILSRHTKMKVTLAASGVKVLANEVYVIPANSDLTMQDGVLHIVSPRVSRNTQIDLFFTSVAADMGERAVGIVLSGYGGDGAQGCRQIKAAGGTVFTQDSSAIVSQMPLSAQATGCVDFVLPAEKIPRELGKLISRFREKVERG